MTTQVLMPTVVAKPVLPAVPAIPALKPASVAVSNPPKRQVPPIADRLVAPSSCPIHGAELTQRLPYRTHLQAKLLCLQADADALLRQLQTLRNEGRSPTKPR